MSHPSAIIDISFYIAISKRSVTMSDNLASADRMIRDLLADPENSSDFFQFALPDHVKSQLDLTKIQLMPGIFVDQSMKEYRTVLPYTIHERLEGEIMTTAEKLIASGIEKLWRRIPVDPFQFV